MPNEPDRYDLDEMMDRLKSRSSRESSEEGELVTRADGSQAIKVRRRKRRSRQPQKERQRRVRMLQVSAVLVLILLLILAAGFVTIYVNTAPFRKEVAEKVAISTGAQAELMQFRMNPMGANANGVDMQWPEGNVLDSLNLRLLSADVSPVAVFTGSFSGTSLSTQSGKLTLRLPQEGGDRRSKPAADGDSPVHFDQCNITNLEVHFDHKQAAVFRLMHTEASFTAATDDQRAMVSLTRGDLLSHNWPMLRLDRAYIEFENELVDVIGASFMHADDDRGWVELAGQVRPYDAQDPSAMEFKAESFLLSGLTGKSLAKIIDGRIDANPEIGESRLLLPLDGSGGMQLSVVFRASEDEPTTLANLPALFALSQVLGDDWVSRPTFTNQVRGNLSRRADEIAILGLEMNAESRMGIRGNLKLKAGALSGDLEIGIAPSVIQGSENRALDAMFGNLRDGYRWVSIEVSGTAAAPVDTFSQQYAEALERLKSGAGNKGDSGEAKDAPDGGSFEELTRPR